MEWVKGEEKNAGQGKNQDAVRPWAFVRVGSGKVNAVFHYC